MPLLACPQTHPHNRLPMRTVGGAAVALGGVTSPRLTDPATDRNGMELLPEGGAPSTAGRAAAGPLPDVVSDADAIASGDPAHALMGHALSWLMRFAPASLGLFYTVDERLSKFLVGPIVARKRGPLTVDLHRSLTRYRERYHLIDPLAPRRFGGTERTVVDLDEAAQSRAVESGHYVAEFLGELGMCGQTSLYLRRDGRIVAGVDLMRSAVDPKPNAQHHAFLRASHGFLQQAYVCASGLPRLLAVAPGAVDRLTDREAAVARLIARGASNAEAARALSISEATVKSHLGRVFQKLQIRSRTQLAVLVNAESSAVDGPPRDGLTPAA